VCFALAAPASPAYAQPPAAAESDTTAAARAHFTKGRELYLSGAYREAIVELDAARAMDPKAKDLVYNLAIVHEKLGEIDEALRYARLYVQMDLEPAERTRAESYIKRLEGAKSEVVVRPVAPPPPVETVRGKLDAATIAAGVVAIGAAGAGVAFGVKALGDKPSASFTTGVNGTYQDLANETSKAHSEAVVADICFGAAAAAAVATAVLYFARTRDVQQKPQAGGVMVEPLVGGRAGGLLLGGTF
jgi:tetratricopeptide (TPR) repeat protein